MKGLVIKSTGSWYLVRSEEGTVLECRIKGKLRLEGSKNTNLLAVGDVVNYELEHSNEPILIKGFNKALITRLEKRRNYIIRKSTNLSKQSHIIASNLDQVFLLATVAMPRTSTGFIDRFLITAEAYGIPASIVFSKTDLYNAEERKDLLDLKSIYENAGYTCYEVSALENIGLDSLKKAMFRKTNLFSGHSGTGKSSLINTLDPSLKQRTGMLSEVHAKGTHTTTNAELLELVFGCSVIDTPGIKEFGMFDIKKEELSHFFPEMRGLFNQCKFNSCLHLTEKFCAVKTAVEAGSISKSRYQTYIGIMTGKELEVNY